ncbi:MAG: YeeE/YedE family protein [Bacteroidetes bacterium]|nr:YeeE/YedE family protein [Bacteroidota bacterium]
MSQGLVYGLIGGMIIGISMVLMMQILGRIGGVSGILKNAVLVNDGNKAWRILFIIGIIVGAAIVGYFKPELVIQREGFSKILLVISGLFVGIGTSMANGCTSGHGVCGMARFSRRSIVATVTFIGTAMIVVLIQSKVAGS